MKIRQSGRAWAAPLLTAAVASIVYGVTVAPDLTWAHYGIDGGELVTAVYTLGVPHPPGYPTYILLGKLFSLIPLGSIAFRLNLFSALCMSLAAAFVAACRLPYTVSRKPLTVKPTQPTTHEPQTTDDRFPITDYGLRITDFTAGLTFAFAPLVWGQALIAEVYALQMAFLAAFLWATLSGRAAWLRGLLLGISITAHLTSALALPLALALTPRRRWLPLLGSLALGLTPFLLLPLLARSGSPIIWGDATTLRGWQQLVSAAVYRAYAFGLPPAAAPARLAVWAWLAFWQLTPLGILLLGWRLWQSRKDASHERRRTAVLAGTAVLFTLYAFAYNTADAPVLLLPALLLAVLLMRPALEPVGRWALLLPIGLLLLNFNQQQVRDEQLIRPYALSLLHTVPTDAILLTPGDATIFSLWYFQHVEQTRTDVLLVDRSLLAFDWYRQRLAAQHPALADDLRSDDVDAFSAAAAGERPFCTATLADPAAAAASVVCREEKN